MKRKSPIEVKILGMVIISFLLANFLYSYYPSPFWTWQSLTTQYIVNESPLLFLLTNPIIVPALEFLLIIPLIAFLKLVNWGRALLLIFSWYILVCEVVVGLFRFIILTRDF